MMPLAFLQNMGPWEWVVILVVALLLLGHRLPGLGKAMGRSVSEFKSGLKEGQKEESKDPAAAPKSAPPDKNSSSN